MQYDQKNYGSSDLISFNRFSNWSWSLIVRPQAALARGLILKDELAWHDGLLLPTTTLGSPTRWSLIYTTDNYQSLFLDLLTVKSTIFNFLLNFSSTLHNWNIFISVNIANHLLQSTCPFIALRKIFIDVDFFYFRIINNIVDMID